MNRRVVTLDGAVSLWEGSLRTAGKQPSTIKGYVRSAEYLVESLGRDADPDAITVEDLESVVAKWRGLSPTTVQNRLVAWREFFRWGRLRGYWRADPTDLLVLPRKDSPSPRRLTRSEVDAMLTAPIDARGLTAIWILVHTGLRRGELIALRWRDIDLVDGVITIQHATAKGRKGRAIPLLPVLRDHLALSKEKRGSAAAGRCFVVPFRAGWQFVADEQRTDATRPASHNAIDRIVKAAAAAAGVREPDEITSHMFRRYLLEQLLDQGVSPYIAAALAGHADIRTTAQYGGTASLRAVRGALEDSTITTPLRDTETGMVASNRMELVGLEPTPEPDSGDDSVGSEPSDTDCDAAVLPEEDA